MSAMGSLISTITFFLEKYPSSFSSHDLWDEPKLIFSLSNFLRKNGLFKRNERRYIVTMDDIVRTGQTKYNCVVKTNSFLWNTEYMCLCVHTVPLAV